MTINGTYEQNVRDGEAYRAALAKLEELTSHTLECPVNAGTWPNADGMYAPDDDHDHASFVLRNLLCCLQHDPDATKTITTVQRDDGDIDFVNRGSQLSFHAEYEEANGAEYEPAEQAALAKLTPLIRDIIAYEFSRDAVTKLATDHSLCPLHFVDWAICFDDEDPTCEQIRTIYPHHHDT